MVAQLIEVTESNIGYKIKTRGDCEILSELIAIKTNVDISYNTLRRFFGVSEVTRPQPKTLNALAQFNGFPSYADFLIHYPKKYSWSLREKAYKLINKDDKTELIDFLNNFEEIQRNVLDLIVSIIRELTINKEVKALKEIFNLELFNPNKINYSELLHLGNTVGLLFRKQQIDYLEFKNSKYFISTMFTLFVDYSSLNRNYGEFTKYIYKTTNEKELKLFSGLVLQLKNLLNNKNTQNNFHYLISKQTHPILLSRYMSIYTLNLGKNQMIETLDLYKKQYCKNNSLEHVYELMFTSILTKNFELMEWLSINFKPIKTTSNHFSDWHNNLLKLVNVFLDHYNKKTSGTKKQMTLLENITIRYSYNEFIEIFICIIKYNMKIEQKKQLKRYMDIINELKYPYFSIQYLEDYFE